MTNFCKPAAHLNSGDILVTRSRVSGREFTNTVLSVRDDPYEERRGRLAEMVEITFPPTYEGEGKARRLVFPSSKLVLHRNENVEVVRQDPP